jgi:hypothetical protein
MKVVFDLGILSLLSAALVNCGETKFADSKAVDLQSQRASDSDNRDGDEQLQLGNDEEEVREIQAPDPLPAPRTLMLRCYGSLVKNGYYDRLKIQVDEMREGARIRAVAEWTNSKGKIESFQISAVAQIAYRSGRVYSFRAVSSDRTAAVDVYNLNDQLNGTAKVMIAKGVKLALPAAGGSVTGSPIHVSLHRSADCR